MRNADQDIARVAMKGTVKEVVITVAGLTAFCNIGSLAVPVFNMQVFTLVLPTRDFGTLISLEIGAAMCLTFWSIIEFLRSLAQELLAARMATRLSLPLLRSAAVSSGSDAIAAQGLADLETVRTFLAGRAVLAPFDIALSPILILALLVMHWALAVLGIACVVVLGLLNVFGDAVSRRALVAANMSSAEAMRGAADAVNAAEPVLAMNMADLLTRRWEVAQATASELVHGAVLRTRAISAATNALRSAMTGAMVALGLALALSGLADSASMVFGNMVLARLLMPFTSIAGTRRQWADALGAWRRLQRTMQNSQARRNTASLPRPKARLVVENISYVPPGGDRPLLRGVSFEVEPGETVAVIGPSSSGKSTLLKLLVGLMPPTTGGVYLDGNSTFMWNREDFARHVGYVPQRPALIEENVAENIARLQNVDEAAVIRAAKAAGLHRTIAALPRGYATVITGGILSGGQRQRLAFARALYTNPSLLVLDEPDAFLDLAGEAELTAILSELRLKGITTVVSTHRPFLLKSMDKVLVLHSGVAQSFGPVAETLGNFEGRPLRIVRGSHELGSAI